MRSTDPFATSLSTWTEVVMRRSMRGLLRFCKQTGVSMSQIGALYQIYHKGSCGVSGLGEDLGVSSAAASQMLDRLVHQQLILRSEDPHDRRGKQIVLTDQGRQMLHASLHGRQRWLSDLAKTLSDDEKAQLTAMLNLLIEKANQIEHNPELEH
jgi:DNA-binding MarR family transcriptional regulator